MAPLTPLLPPATTPAPQACTAKAGVPRQLHITTQVDRLDELLDDLDEVIAALAAATWGPNGDATTAAPLPDCATEAWAGRIKQLGSAIDGICAQRDLWEPPAA